MMYIIAGEFRKQKLLAPKGSTTRPTSARLRETVFNICQTYVEGTRVLDICAGSGAIGLEALSRGAKSATFIDNSYPAINSIRENVHKFHADDRAEICYQDALHALRDLERKQARFEICYLDPPYHDPDLLRSIIEFLDQSDIISPDGVLFIEDSANSLINGLVLNQLALESKRRCGDSLLYVFRN